MLFYKFYFIRKNVSVTFALKLMNFTDFYDKLLNFTISEFHGISASLVLA